MGKHIHTRIFLLVLAVILFLTLGAGLIFSASSARYVEYAARRDGEAMISMVEKIVKDMCWKETGRQSAKEERESSKRILQKVKETIKEEAFDGKLLVFNSKYRLVYPETYEEGELPDALTQRCQEILKQGGNVRPERVQIENKSWNLQCFTLDTVHSVRAKYFIAAVPAPDMDIFWDAVRQLMWGVLTAAAAAASVLAWLISKSISRPLQKLCSQIQMAGEGRSAQINEIYSLSELETLKRSYNQMESKIREKEEEKKRFFQNVSHDLKTPLASITGYAQGISCGIIEDGQKAAGIILTESIRMTELVESILSLTKMDNQELELHITEVDLVEFVDECLEALRGIRISCELCLACEEQELPIETDPKLLERILQNIISNSFRYAETTIAIRLKDTSDGVLILVEDDGPGFDKEDLPHIFERFYKGKGGKTGIGLSVVWAGVCYLGGTVEAGNRNPPSKGAYYCIRLPKTFRREE